jgi:CheY-like chemotaxis protein
MTDEKDEKAAEKAAEADGIKSKLQRLSVLVAEADATLSRRTAELLTELGVREVVSVHTGAQVLESLRARAFDMLLCAARLGSSSALWLVKAARDVSPATRVVLLQSEGDEEVAPPAGVEVLARPFSRAKLGALLARVAAPSGGLWCEVPQLSLADILQLYHQNRRSIVVLLSGPIAGRITLSQGQIVDATTDQLRGLAALSRLLEAESGLVRTETPTEDLVPTINGHFQHVLLEAAQKLDERRRDSMLPVFGADTDTTPTTHTGIPVFASSPAPEPELQLEPPPPLPVAAASEPTLESTWRQSPAAAVMASGKRPTPSSVWFASAALVALVVFVGAYVTQRASEPDSALNRTTLVEVAGQDHGATDDMGPGASNPVAPAPSGGVMPPGGGAPGVANEPEQSVSALRPRPPTPPAEGAPSEPTDGTAPPSFVLSIQSKPSRARVTEKGKYVGRTPLRVKITRSSVARAPREFIVQLPGYQPATVTQSDSVKDVRTALALTPAPGQEDVVDSDPNEVQKETVGDEPPSNAGVGGADTRNKARQQKRPNVEPRPRQP